MHRKARRTRTAYGLRRFQHLVRDARTRRDQRRVPRIGKVARAFRGDNQSRLRNGEADNQKGISKLENWFSINGIVDYEEHIQFLRDLQESNIL